MIGGDSFNVRVTSRLRVNAVNKRSDDPEAVAFSWKKQESRLAAVVAMATVERAQK